MVKYSVSASIMNTPCLSVLVPLLPDNTFTPSNVRLSKLSLTIPKIGIELAVSD